jgi:predicted DNA-binding transcriptional regulator AlpA
VEDYLSCDDLARSLGVSKGTVYRWVRQGKLPKPIRRRAPVAVWPRAEVQELIDRRRGQRQFPFGAAA